MGKGVASIVIIIVVIVVLGAGFYAFQNKSNLSNYQQKNADKGNQQSQPAENQPSSLTETNTRYGARGCTGKGTVNFTSPPRKIQDIEMILPLGMMSSEHITPTDHQYYYPHNWNPNPGPDDIRDVLAPADGVVTSVQRMPSWTFYSKQGLEDYRLEIYHTCTFYTIYIHLLKLSPKIKEVIGDSTDTRTVPANIPVKAGEVLGGATSLDFSVHNSDVTLKGFAVPQHYSGEPWKIHTVDPFDYFNEPLKSQLIAKTERTAQPYGGKIDYDIDGKIVGNWFVENSGGYPGTISGQYNYWSNHVAITYDAIDPSHIIFSTGTFTTSGEGKQFGIKGNSPDSATLDKNSGIIKYELVTYDYKTGGTGAPWDRMTYASNLKAVNNDNEIRGVVLLQLLDDRKLRIEIFPGKIAAEVSGFVSPTIYER